MRNKHTRRKKYFYFTNFNKINLNNMSYPYQIKTLAHYHETNKKSVENPTQFWFDIAQHFTWKKPPTDANTILNWNFTEPTIEWFKGCKLNITENCLDRHIETIGDKLALIWEPNNPNESARTFTYAQLLAEVERFANVLKNNGVKKGDRVCIYLPMIPELAIAMLSCARIGAIHSVIFGGFSAKSIIDRVSDAQCNLIITADGGFRGNKTTPLKSIVDEA
jgi:acetyl-CoA synthetase